MDYKRLMNMYRRNLEKKIHLLGINTPHISFNFCFGVQKNRLNETTSVESLYNICFG